MAFDTAKQSLEALRRQIESGPWPEDEQLAAFLRGCDGPLPDDVREYLAARIEGSIKRPRGRPQKGAFDQLLARLTHRLRPAAAEARQLTRQGHTRDDAIRIAADHHGVAFEALRNYLSRSTKLR